MRARRKRSFLGAGVGGGFPALCARAGRLAVLGKRSEALGILREGIRAYSGRAQQYQLLCQGGDCLFGLGDMAAAAAMYSEALGAAYEPAAARARLGLARCLLADGKPREALSEVGTAIDEAGKAARQGYIQDGGGQWTLVAVPICAQGIAMRAYPEFAKSGQEARGRALLRKAIALAKGNPYRMTVFLGKLALREGDGRAAEKAFREALGVTKLGPRSLPALRGWCRCSVALGADEIAGKISSYSERMSSRAILAACGGLRAGGNGTWPNVVAVKMGKNCDRVARTEVLSLRAMAAGNRAMWREMATAAEELVTSPGTPPAQAAGAAADAAEARWHLGKDIPYALAGKAPDPAAAQWAIHRRMAELGDGKDAERFFKARGKSAAARFNLALALQVQGKKGEGNRILAELASRSDSPWKARNAAVIALLEGSGAAGESRKIARGRIDKASKKGGAQGLSELSHLATGINRARGPRAISEEALQESMNIFRNLFPLVTEPAEAVRMLRDISETVGSFGGRGGVRDLFLSTGRSCLPMLAGGGDSFFAYIVSVYGDTFRTGMVIEARELWEEVRGISRIPDKWKAARVLLEGEVRVMAGQSSGLPMVERARRAFGTGEFAARACYILALDRMGRGGSASGWAVAGLDALGARRGARSNIDLLARLEVLSAGLDPARLGKRGWRWRRSRTLEEVSGKILRDLSVVESPTSA